MDASHDQKQDAWDPKSTSKLKLLRVGSECALGPRPRCRVIELRPHGGERGRRVRVALRRAGPLRGGERTRDEPPQRGAAGLRARVEDPEDLPETR